MSQFGMTDEELLQVCAGGDPEQLKKFRFWNAEIYSFGKLIREYAYYPKQLDLWITTDHGPAQNDAPLALELHTNSYAQLYHSPRLVQAWKQVSSKPCYTLKSPFAFYRRKHKITPSAKAKGTLIFPTHSTHHISVEKNWRSYIERLLDLPEKFHPFSACLYFLDVQKGLHHIFREYNIPIYSAGQWADPLFVDRFYNILQHVKYATASVPGSYLFYCVEMGIPFFLYGDQPTLVNTGNPFVKKGAYNPYKEYKQLNKVAQLFQEPVDEITPEQKALVETELGLRDGLSRSKLSYVLYKAYAKQYLKHRYPMLRRFFSGMIPKAIKHQYRLRKYPEYQKAYRKEQEILRLKALPRYQVGQTTLLAYPITFVDAASFLFIYDEMFTHQIYKFTSTRKQPYIIDAGANIGLSVIYFKYLYPDAEIVAFEPDNKVFDVLKENLNAFHLKNITLVNKALWDQETVLEFVSEGAGAGRIAKEQDQGQLLTLPTTRLRSYLEQATYVDLLKMDIEGAESKVLEDCQDLLGVVDRLFVEYHSFVGQQQELHKILDILHRSGFRYNIQHIGTFSPHPFVKVNQYLNMDLQLNIFAFRP